MKITTAYYPEYFPREEWEHDLEKIREMGAEAIRIAEFSWSRLQPERERFDFSWLDDAIDTAQKFGIQVILCTPTATPPAWLSEEFPEILPVNIHGRRSLHGARQHRCYNAPAYLRYSDIIVEKLAERYGRHPNVIAWQLDNELGGEQKKCYCSHCRQAFDAMLADKYHGNIAELNERWGNHFWSQDYQRFSQIPLPMHFGSDLGMVHHPSLNLEFLRFCSDSIVSYARRQAELIRRYSPYPITTNEDTFYWGDNVNLYEIFRTLDVGGMDVYSEDDYVVGFYADITRSVKGDRFWMMEFGDSSSDLTEKMALCARKGCELFNIFKFRSFPWGQEQSKNALLEILGNPAPNYSRVKEYSREAPPVRRERARVGMIYDFDSSWAYNAKGLLADMRACLHYAQYLEHTVYKTLYEAGEAVDFIFEWEKLPQYDLVVVPLHILHDEALEKALIAYVSGGGRLVADTELFQKNQDNVFRTQLAEIYQTVFGQTEERYLTDADIEGMRLHAYGQGKGCLLRAAGTQEDWRNALAALLD